MPDGDKSFLRQVRIKHLPCILSLSLPIGQLTCRSYSDDKKERLCYNLGKFDMKENPSKFEIFVEMVGYETVNFLDDLRRFNMVGDRSLLAHLIDVVLKKDQERAMKHYVEYLEKRGDHEPYRPYVPHFKREKDAEELNHINP